MKKNLIIFFSGVISTVLFVEMTVLSYANIISKQNENYYYSFIASRDKNNVSKIIAEAEHVCRLKFIEANPTIYQSFFVTQLASVFFDFDISKNDRIKVIELLEFQKNANFENIKNLSLKNYEICNTKP